MKKLNNVLDWVTKPLELKFSEVEIQLKLHWKEIIHKPLSEYSRPAKVIFDKYNKQGTLYISVNNGSVALEIQYLISIILEKIAILFGYKIIHNIKIKQEIKFSFDSKVNPSLIKY